MRVLVADGRGYFGTVLIPFLCEVGHQVDGFGLGRYEGCDFGPMPERNMMPTCDISNIAVGPLVERRAVPCRAAPSNDPPSDLNHAAIFPVKDDGTLHLARTADAGTVTLHGESGISAGRGLSPLADEHPSVPEAETVPGASSWR